MSVYLNCGCEYRGLREWAICGEHGGKRAQLIDVLMASPEHRAKLVALIEDMDAPEFIPHYSGEASQEFWETINALPERQQHTAYTLGVVLQNVEHDILRKIANERDDARSTPSGPRTEGD